jgi:hypothetical protein
MAKPSLSACLTAPALRTLFWICRELSYGTLPMANNACKILLGCGLAMYIYAIYLATRGDSAVSDAEVKESDLETLDRLLVVTRIHMNSASSLPAVAKVIAFLTACNNYADGVLICVGTAEHSIESVTMINEYIASVRLQLANAGIEGSKIHFLPISPWGYFTPALNHAIQFAQDHAFPALAFQVAAFPGCCYGA